MDKYISNELSKKDTNMTKGLAIIFMVLLHLFCRIDNLPYECLKIGGVPFAYYIGQFADCCVVIYCFCSGYALEIINYKYNNYKEYYKNRIKSLLKFLINYWMVLIIFSMLGILFDKSGTIPGSIKDFLLHLFLLSKNYNGAWWFVLTYVLLVFLSRPIYKLINRFNPIIINILFLGIYLISYIQKFKNVFNFGVPVLDWIVTQLALLGTSTLPFVWGMYFYKFKLFTKIKKLIYGRLKNWHIISISIVVVFAMIVGHGMLLKSVIVAPITGIITIVLFNVIDKGKCLNAVFDFFGNHSTNIWLTHMFFYSVLFKDFVFVAKYPILIFTFIMVLCIASSYVIQFVNKQVLKVVKL